ncbi:MAG: hypothetical protein J6A08_12480 [Lachnospiraceae bacterium]|nr:hypothetical protein [Lachnospiraceae bacterium]
MDNFTKAELNSVLFYQGAVEYIELNITEADLVEFYRVTNAYEVINMLLFPGVTNEESRIGVEQRSIPFVLLDNVPELLSVYCNLYSAMCKYAYCHTWEENAITYRYDRMNTLDFLRNGKTCSFLSTSLEQKGATDEEFKKKNGILILEVEASKGVVYLNVNEISGEKSKYPEEKEILFPPFLQIDMEEVELTNEEKQYRDINDESPKAKYKIVIKNNCMEKDEDIDKRVDQQKLYGEILEEESVEAAKEVWEKLRNHEMLQEDVVKKYQEWKEKIQLYLDIRFRQIHRQTGRMWHEQERRMKLQQEVRKFYSETDQKRIEYKNQIKWFNIALSTLYPLSSFAIAMSFVELLETAAKISGLLFSTVAAILGGIGTSLAIDMKWEQRTVTYLRLDELQRDMEYETNWNKEKTDEYIERFKDIVKADDARCESNTQHSAYLFQSNSKGKGNSDK